MTKCCCLEINFGRSAFVLGVQHDTHVSPSSCPRKTAYLLGRGVRFLVSVPLAIADVALQILQCITLPFELLCLKLEKSVRKIQLEDTCMTLVYPYLLTSFFQCIRNNFTHDNHLIFAEDLGLYTPRVYQPDGPNYCGIRFSGDWAKFLRIKLGLDNQDQFDGPVDP